MNWFYKIKFILAGALELPVDSVIYTDKLWSVDRLKALTHRKKIKIFYELWCWQTRIKDILKKRILILKSFRLVFWKGKLSLNNNKKTKFMKREMPEPIFFLFSIVNFFLFSPIL